MMTAHAKALLRSIVLILLAVSLVTMMYRLLVYVDIEQWDLLAVATAAVRTWRVRREAISAMAIICCKSADSRT